MLQNNKIIAQVEQPLESSLIMSIPAPKKPEAQAAFNLKDVERQVDHLIKRLPSNLSQLQSDLQPKIDNNTVPVQKTEVEPPQKNIFLSRYNYTGKNYRFEQAEMQMNISKPQIKQTCKTEVQISHPKEQILSVKQEKLEKQSNLAEESFDGSELKFPHHSYYIVFDKDKNKDKNKKQVNRTVVDAKSLILQKKVQKLEQQIKSMKFGETTQSFNMKKDKKDGKMRLEKLLDSIIG